MARQRKSSSTPRAVAGSIRDPIADYRHPEATRKNNPPKIAAEGYVPLLPKAAYSYSPRLAPVLRFDPTGTPDELPEFLAKATREPLSVPQNPSRLLF